MPAKAYQVCREGEAGGTLLELSEALGVDIATITRWQKLGQNTKSQFHAFCTAIKEGRAFSDDKPEASLYKRANGFEYEETEVVTEFQRGTDGQLKPVPVKMIKRKKYYPPDVAAAFIWLKNRRPDRWSDKPTPKPNEEQSKGFVDALQAAGDQLWGELEE
jgi:hypothetical protein